PTITPTFNEFAMFMAFASSLRSADLSRQVGAVVARENEILSTGANDCPCYGGGLYWPAFIGDRIDDTPRGRDYKRGCDSNTVEKNKLVADIAKRFPAEYRPHAEKILSESRINEITEYGRVVHAEMEALLACARSTRSCIGATLYCTTFPCHNCAKHIIAAGIEQVVYIEPYPKSKAIEFHDDSASVDKLDGEEKKVRFKPFIGVGPRQFFDLFSLSLSSGRPVKRKTQDGKIDIWSAASATPRVPMLPVAHRRFEMLASAYLNKLRSGQEAQK
ncbi:MAG: dCMP deaminase family protein, partial [Planctomycetaceae bacterium]